MGYKLLWFGAAFAVQAGYWGLLRRGFRRSRAQDTVSAALPPVSVVVAARNEEATMPGLLTALVEQDYPDYEIVVVDDASDDATARIVAAWPDPARPIKLVRVTDPVAPRKKNALTQGIAVAAHEVLVFTDADCQPPPGWLRSMAVRHRAGGRPRLLIGYSPFRKQPGLLNRLARYETFVTGFFTAAAAGLGRPYMAVGRNLSYTRPVFRAIDGFTHSALSLSGDDDLLVQETARRDAAEIVHVFDPAGFVPTDAPATWRQWFRQKTRHTSASRFYPRGVQMHLTLFHTSNTLLWLAPVFLGWPGVGLLALKLVQQRAVLKEAADALHEQDLVSRQPLLDLLYMAYNAFIAPIGVARLPRRW